MFDSKILYICPNFIDVYGDDSMAHLGHRDKNIVFKFTRLHIPKMFMVVILVCMEF